MAVEQPVDFVPEWDAGFWAVVVVVLWLVEGALIGCIPVVGWVWLVEYSLGYVVELLGGPGI